MQKCLIAAIAALTLLSTAAEARDDRLHKSIAEAMNTESAKEKLDPDIRTYWGDQSYPAPVQKMGEYTSNKKTNAVNKSDTGACQWAFLSAMISLQQRAKAEGGNAIVDIHSVYKNEEFRSTTEFECGAGKIMAGVALRGTVVKLP